MAVEKEKRPATVKVPVSKLRRRCRELFGVSESSFDGAVSALKTDKISVAEMKSFIENWLKKEVK